MPTPPHTTDTPCPLWRRLIALVYDLLIVVAIVMVVGLLCQLATGGALLGSGAHTHIPWWYQPLQGVIVAAYFISSWLRGGQTVGMRPWHIRVTDSAGAKPLLRQAVVRLLIAAAPMVLLLLTPVLGLRATLWTVLAGWVAWFAVALFDRRRRALHDMVAGTEIRRLDQPQERRFTTPDTRRI